MVIPLNRMLASVWLHTSLEATSTYLRIGRRLFAKHGVDEFYPCSYFSISRSWGLQTGFHVHLYRYKKTAYVNGRTIKNSRVY